jgi:hypothetical protein
MVSSPHPSPGAERSAKPQERQDYHAATLYLPYQALSLPIIPARREEDVTVPARRGVAALFCPTPNAWQPRRHADGGVLGE